MGRLQDRARARWRVAVMCYPYLTQLIGPETPNDLELAPGWYWIPFVDCTPRGPFDSEQLAIDAAEASRGVAQSEMGLQ
jgi:hypothetical protein